MASYIMLAPADENYLLVGTYTGEKSEGIYVYKFRSSDGSYKEVGHVKTSNPSYLAVSPEGDFVYAANENGKDGNGGEVSSFSFNKKTGELTFLNKQLSGGDHPCYVEIDKTGKWVFAGNYSSGTFSVLPVNNDGSLGAATQTIRHEGSGPDKKRQDKPHVHCTILSADNKWLFVPDLGIDKVMIYVFDDKTGKVTTSETAFASTEAGAGPRHLVFHPSNTYAYMVEEMSGNVSVFEYASGKLKNIQTVSLLQKDFKGAIGSADIHVSEDGRFLYASNRGDANDISVFSIDEKSGTLKKTSSHSTLGKGPRNFNFDPSQKFVLVGNQSNDEIVIFHRNAENGQLKDSGNRIKVGKPVCVKWVAL